MCADARYGRTRPFEQQLETAAAAAAAAAAAEAEAEAEPEPEPQPQPVPEPVPVPVPIPVPVPCRAVPCRAVPSRAEPCRAVPMSIRWACVGARTGTQREVVARTDSRLVGIDGKRHLLVLCERLESKAPWHDIRIKNNVLVGQR